MMENRSQRNRVSRRNPKFYRGIPKIDLHRHLEGSLRLTTLLEIGRAHGLDIPGTGQLRSLVQINHEEPFTFQNFLSKFETLRLFYRSPEVISRVVQEAIADAAQDQLHYLELRFTPVALSKAQGFSLAAVMDWVCEGAKIAQHQNGIQVSLIASVNRHESLDMAEQVALLAAERRSKGIVGMDLAGNESKFSALPFSGIFREARQAGLYLTIHAGEWAGAGNISDAILQLGADRIGHGVRVLEEERVVELARDRGTVFEVCVTSNYQSGVVPALSDHPIQRMIAAGLNVTINTDDPSVSQITLSEEYRLVAEDLGMSLDTLKECVFNSAKAAFLSSERRAHLLNRFENAWADWETDESHAI
jgi:adenosine deaminase